MCIICIELEKSLITPLEAQRNLTEIAFDINLEHYLEVQEKIQQIQDKNDFSSLLKKEKTVEFCSGCHCDPCDCDWGTNE